MLNRVTQALVKILHPISRSHENPAQEKPKQENPDKENSPNDTPDNVLEFRKPASTTTPEENVAKDEAPVAGTHDPKSSVPVFFIDVLSKIRTQQLTMMKWLGMKAYKTTQEKKKKIGLTDKGAVVDEKAE